MSQLIFYGGASIQGTDHDENQDAWCVIGHRSRDRGILVVLADGVSVTPFGRWAAEQACRKMREAYNGSQFFNQKVILQTIKALDETVRAKGKGQAACTLSFCWIVSGKCTMFKLGDSPVCHVRNGVGSFVAPAEDALFLKSYIGMGDKLIEELRLHELRLLAEDWLVLTSDGVSDVLTAAELGNLCMLAEGDLNVVAQKITHYAQLRGSKDDATAVILNYKDRPSSRLAYEAFFILG
ncbi:MAG: PP2C family protein-serine/threonine phosphatase [Myxococcota bacterium]